MRHMTSAPHPLAAAEVAPRIRASHYPEPFASRVAGRTKRALGEHFGLRNFGVNLTTLQSGAMSALYHRHTHQDEFVHVLQGQLTLVMDGRRITLTPGMCAGFPAGVTHHLINETGSPATFLEVGDRVPGDCASYPEDDLLAVSGGNGWIFMHRDGTPYPALVMAFSPVASGAS